MLLIAYNGISCMSMKFRNYDLVIHITSHCVLHKCFNYFHFNVKEVKNFQTALLD